MRNIIKISFHIIFLGLILFASFNHETTIYIFYQAKGQFSMLMHTKSFEEFEKSASLNEKQKENLVLIEKIKKYSVDSLHYIPTKNFTTIFDQGNEPILWTITASEKFRIQPYYWTFPVVGEVSYKGFFDEKKALSEKDHLICEGYDVDIRSVSAWSTLGWFKDPILSSMLSRSKGYLCNLIFHELFHATYYAKSSVDFNENLASFVAHKATLRFLKNDSLELYAYVKSYEDNIAIQKHMGKQVEGLHKFYDSISDLPASQKSILRLKKLYQVARSLDVEEIGSERRRKGVQKNILEFKNGWFVDFNQYNGMQDSLEGVFNKIYQSDIAKMVQSLK